MPASADSRGTPSGSGNGTTAIGETLPAGNREIIGFRLRGVGGRPAKLPRAAARCLGTKLIGIETLRGERFVRFRAARRDVFTLAPTRKDNCVTPFNEGFRWKKKESKDKRDGRSNEKNAVEGPPGERESVGRKIVLQYHPGRD